MTRQFIVAISIVLVCLSFYPESVTSKDYTSIYPTDYSNCNFPFTYKGKTYNNCTTDGDNGDTLWCSLTPDYIGMFTYCWDFTNSTLNCKATYSVNGKEYSGCNLLSRSSSYKQCKTDNEDYPVIYCPDAVKDAKKEYRKLRRDCKKKYKDISEYHTMCFSPSPFAVQVNITEDEKQELLDMHNQYRAAVPSEYMFKLYWDDELAQMAQSRGDKCVFDHDLAGNRIIPDFGWKNGQNMVWSTEIRMSLATLIDMMLSAEKDRFVYGTGCNPTGTCLHYTQAMLSNITRMGCAHTQCVYKTHIDRFLTCNYLLSQYASTYMIPYVQTSASNAASKCPSKAAGGLCDCGNKTCDYNIGEYLDPNTCICKVPNSKRSLNKRDTNVDEPMIAAPSGGLENLISKRSIDLRKKSQKKKSKN